jgi:hypothetical protein
MSVVKVMYLTAGNSPMKMFVFYLKKHIKLIGIIYFSLVDRRKYIYGVVVGKFLRYHAIYR